MNYFVAYSGVYQDNIGKYACFLDWKSNLKEAQNAATKRIKNGYKNVIVFCCNVFPKYITLDFINEHKII